MLTGSQICLLTPRVLHCRWQPVWWQCWRAQGVCQGFLERMGLQRLMQQESLGSLDRKSGHCSSMH